jgi:probable DNA metabolism protein
VAATLTAAFKVCRETDRLHGLLRFAPDSQGVYTARCAPDHFVLPGLAEHFFRRFGDTPWTIIDEKRALALVCPADGEPRLVQGSAQPHAAAPVDEPWADLWRGYHQAINNEGRKNPALQRQLMPVRYWKYLTEV